MESMTTIRIKKEMEQICCDFCTNHVKAFEKASISVQDLDGGIISFRGHEECMKTIRDGFANLVS